MTAVTDDAFPQIRTDEIDVDESDAMLEGLGQLYDLRVIDTLCRATGRDTLEYVQRLLAIMHGEPPE